MEFVKKPLLCDEDVIQTDDIITYGFLVQEYLREYSNIVNSKRWEPTDIKKVYKYESLLLTSFTVTIEFQKTRLWRKFIVKSATKLNTVNLE